MSPNKYNGAALSIILVKPYYADISTIDRHEVSERWALFPTKWISDLCINE